jgi:hypothetical protein
MEINQPKSVKPKMGEKKHKLRSGINLQGALKKKTQNKRA